MQKLIILAAAAAAVAVPAAAQFARAPQAGGGITRAEAQARFRDAFVRVDRNRDGYVTQAEAQAFHGAARAERREHREERREARFERLDTDNNGVITRAEFFAQRERGDRADRAERRRERLERRELRGPRRGNRGFGFGARRFERMDVNRDGRVSLAEATEQGLRRFDRIDANRDGRITPDERRDRRERRLERRRNREAI